MNPAEIEAPEQAEIEAVEQAEEWRAITGFATYSVSNLGRVRNDQTGRVLRLCEDRYGYYMVDLYNQGRRSHCKVHRLVCQAFIDPIPEGYEVDHINHDRTNNVVSNLRIVSKSEQQRNKTRYRGLDVEYLDELPEGSNPITDVRGRPVREGHYRHGHEFFVEIAGKYRRLTHMRSCPNSWYVQLKCPDGRHIKSTWHD